VSAWWDEDKVLCLITPQEFAEIEAGTPLTCIDDTIAIKGVHPIDDDTRFGHLAYGVTGDHPLRLALLALTTRQPGSR
jgi:hypothetical protein